MKIKKHLMNLAILRTYFVAISQNHQEYIVLIMLE